MQETYRSGEIDYEEEMRQMNGATKILDFVKGLHTSWRVQLLSACLRKPTEKTEDNHFVVVWI